MAKFYEFQGGEYVYPVVPPVLGIKQALDRNREEIERALKLKEEVEARGEEFSGEIPEELEPIVFGLVGVTTTDSEAYQQSDMELTKSLGGDKASKEIKRRYYDRVKERVKFIRGLRVDGRDITDFDTFYEKAPKELVTWVCNAVFSTMTLRANELKNS